MRKLYEKKEIVFAILWIVVYCVVFGTIRGNFGDESIYTLLALAAFTAGITAFVKGNHLEEKYGLARWPKEWIFSFLSGSFIGDSGDLHDSGWLCGRNDLQGIPFQGDAFKQ